MLGYREGKGLGTRIASEFLILPLTGVPQTMLGMWSLLLLWGLATPCGGLLETVGTLARIDKDELGKGEPRWTVSEGPSCRVKAPWTCVELMLSGTMSGCDSQLRGEFRELKVCLQTPGSG